MSSCCSWVWGRILKLRSVTQPLISVSIGNGDDTSFWFDSWHPSGPLYQKYNTSLLKNLALSTKSSIANFIKDNNGK